MKKILITIFLFFIIPNSLNAKSLDTADFERLYNETQLADFELVHDLDPYQVEDYCKYAWAPYPLFRTCADLYFKNIHISPGYYLLTPRTMNGREYVFFKSGGKVAYVVPVVETDIVPEDFYKIKIPQRKMNTFEKIYTVSRRNFYKIFKKGKKTDPPPAFVEVSTVDNIFFEVDLYLDTKKYMLIFKKTPD